MNFSKSSTRIPDRCPNAREGFTGVIGGKHLETTIKSIELRKKGKPMNIEIRMERPSDYRETENVVRDAFWNFYSPGCDDHYLVHIMRDHTTFVPELDVVAVYEGEIVGNVVYLTTYIEGDDGTRYEVLSLGPVAVLPKYQGKGVGAKLIAYTKELAKKMGYRAILLYGNPTFYTKQGFNAAEKYGIRDADNMYADALHVCGLYDGALDGISGRYYEDSIYEVDKRIVEEFDQDFPTKEKITGTPTQIFFLEMAERCRSAEI